MATMAERLIQAWHSHDARWVAALFAEDYPEGQLYFDLHPGVADVHLREQVNFMAVWPSVACDPAEQQTQPENQCGR
jgi:hypothetical protein